MQFLATVFLGVVSLVFLSSVAMATSAAPAVDFTLPNLRGEAVRLADFKGRPILLKLGTTWCPACARQRTELRLVEAELQAAGVVVVEVFLQESAAQVQKALVGGAGEAIILIDDQQVQRGYNVYTIPRVLLIDRNFLVQRDGSLITAAELKAALPAWAAGSDRRP